MKLRLTYHQKNAEKKSEQILKGALSQFLQYGYLSTSMDKIAEASGVSKQTLYTHFGDKESLFKALIKQVTTHKFQLVWSQPLQGKPENVLKKLAERMIKEISDFQYLDFVHIVITEAKNHPEIGELFLSNVAKPAISILTNYFKNCPDLILSDPEAIAHIFVNTIINHILIQQVLQGKKVMPLDSERLIDSLITLITSTGKS